MDEKQMQWKVINRLNSRILRLEEKVRILEEKIHMLKG